MYGNEDVLVTRSTNYNSANEEDWNSTWQALCYTPENVKQAKEVIIKHLAPFKPEVPLTGPLELNVNWYFPKGTKHKHLEWRVTKPDTDNLEKMLKDCMTELGFWNDDAQVVSEHIDKVWSDEPTGIAIEINQLNKFKEDT